MKRRLMITIVGIALVASARAEDWPQFRGLDRNGISPEVELLEAWPDAGLEEVWRRDLGEGYSGITVVGDRLYTMYAAAGEVASEGDGAEVAAEGETPGPTELEYAAAFDAASGNEIWRVPLGEKLETQFGHGPRSTPTVDGEVVYFVDSYGTLVALATSDGSERWRVSVTETFGSKRPFWGFSASVLALADSVLIEAGGADGKLFVALDKASGEERWSSGDGQGIGYNSPLHLGAGDDSRIVYLAGQKVRAIDEQGKELWSFEIPPGEAHAMPAYIPPNRYFASGVEGVGAHLLEVDTSGEETTVTEVWSNNLFKNHFSSSLYYDGHLYGFDNATLKCIDAATGEQKWAKRGLGKGSMILADGHLLVLSDRGKLVRVEASGEGYVEKGAFQALEGKCWTAPTLAGGTLYLRNHDQMVGYVIKG